MRLNKPLTFHDADDFAKNDYSVSTQNAIEGQLRLREKDYLGAIPFLEAAQKSGHLRLKIEAAIELGIAYVNLEKLDKARSFLNYAANQNDFPYASRRARAELAKIQGAQNLMHIKNSPYVKDKSQ